MPTPDTLFSSNAPTNSPSPNTLPSSKILGLLSLIAASAALALVKPDSAQAQFGFPGPGQPAPKKVEEAPKLKATIYEHVAHPVLAEWIAKAYPNADIAGAVEDLSHDNFAKRQRAQKKLDELAKALIEEVNPLPGVPLSSADPERAKRLERHYALTMDEPTRIPPMKGPALEVLALLDQHTQNPIAPFSEKVRRKLDGVIIDVKKGENDFFRVLATICRKTDLHWTLEQGTVVLREGKGAFNTSPTDVQGKYGIFRKFPLEKNAVMKDEEERPEHFVFMGEPGWKKIVEMQDLHYRGIGVRLRVHPGVPDWHNPYKLAVKPQLSGLAYYDKDHPSKVITEFSAATDPVEKVFPLSEVSGGDMGMHQVKVEPKKRSEIHGAQAHLQNVGNGRGWHIESSYPREMQGWLTAAGTSLRIIAEDGSVIPHTVTFTNLHERKFTINVQATTDAKPRYLRMRGFQKVDGEAWMFTPGNETRTLNPGPAQK